MKFGFQLCKPYDPNRHPVHAISELKFDGMMVLVEDGRMYNRRGRDVTYQFPEVSVPRKAVVVGEVCILKNGVSQFHMLQKRNVDNPKEIELRSRLFPATLVAFDVLQLNGQHIADKPLVERRKVLEALGESGVLKGGHVADYMDCPKEKVEEVLEAVRSFKGEGIIVKDLDAPYVASRNGSWMKVKAWNEGEYDILEHEVTEKGALVVFIVNSGYRQKVVCNAVEMAKRIKAGEITRLRIRYLDVEESGALRQPHIVGRVRK